jgi:hypothetical protein
MKCPQTGLTNRNTWSPELRVWLDNAHSVSYCHVNQIGGELVDGYSLGRAHIHQKQFTAESWTTHDGVEALRAHADSGQVICRRPRPGEGELVQSLVWVQPPEHLVA